MIRARWSGVLAVVLVCAVLAPLPHEAAAQQPTLQDVPGQPPAASDDLAASKTLRTGAIGTIASSDPPATLWPDLLPELSQQALTWIAIVVILVLTLQTKPLLSWHNLDGLMLALTALLLPLRENIGVIEGDPTEQTVQWWTYLLLSLIGLYWLARGLRLLFAKAVPTFGPNVSEGAMFVLIVAGLFVAGSTVMRAPLSGGSRDGLIGGIYTAETGKLPYGDALDHDARSPLLYLLHAGMVELVPPTYEANVEPVKKMVWDERAAWLSDDAWETVDLGAVRLVNALLFVLLFAALAGIGHRLHSLALGQALVAILCIFPGVLECLSRPDIMLPTVLLAWSIVFVTLPGLGGLLSVFLLVLAGLAWPWAWLTLPVMLAYFFRQGWHALGATIGLLAGMAAVLVGITTLVAPTLPRHDGALREAGITPTYAARLSDDGTVVIEQHRPSETIESTFKSWAWKLLLDREQTRLDSTASQAALPNGADAGSIMFRDIVATGPAREALQRDYRAALAQESETTRACTSLRTLVEATWKPAAAPNGEPVGVWDLWSPPREDAGATWIMIRRVGKVVAGLLALLVTLVLIRGQRGRLHELIGGLLVVSAAALLISTTGAATNWIWLMPAALATLAVKGQPPATKPPPPPLLGGLSPLEHGPAPRITVEK